MADDLNALLQANHASTVLQGIMNPAQVNPLAAITSANQAAQAEFNTRKLQAQQAAGQLATESIDPVTKQFDPAVYNAKIARAGPDVAMYAQPALQDASTLSQTQLAQQHAKAGYIQGVIGALDDNSTPAQVNGALDRAASNGMFTPTDIANMRAHVPTNQADMPAFIQHLRLIGGSVQQQLEQMYGTTGSQTGPSGATIGFTQAPASRGSGISAPAQPGAPQGLSAAQLDAPHTWKDATGQEHQGTLRTYLESIGVQAPTGGVGAPAANPAGVPPPGTIPGTGRIVPPPGLGNPNKPGAPPAPVPTVAAPPATGANIPGPPPGTEQDVAAYKAAQAAMPDQQKNVVAGLAALQALQLARSGPGTATTNAWKSFMIAQGIPGADQLDTGGVEAYQIARKNLLRFAQSSGGRVGTDLGLATQIESNPNTEMLLNNVNDHILKQDLGLARQRIAQTLTAPGQGGTGKTDFGSGMGAHVQNFTAQTDPVAFAWDLLTPQERTQHMQQIEKIKGGVEKWERSMKIARDTGVWSAPTTQAPAQTPATPPPVVQPPHPLLVPNG